MKRPQQIIVEEPSIKLLAVVVYRVRDTSPGDFEVDILKFVPAVFDGALNLGQPAHPSTDERIAVIKAIARAELGATVHLSGGAR